VWLQVRKMCGARMHSTRHVVVALAATVFGMVAASPTPTFQALVPHFKWGQNREKLMITIALRGLDRASVRLEFRIDRLLFIAKDSKDKEYALDLELVQDVLPADCHWEHLQRPDRWGDAVLATLRKTFPRRWDALVVNPASYAKLMDRDWTREDQALELPEDDPFLREHLKYLQPITMEGLEDARSDVEALVILVRHSECDQCRNADETFAAVAKQMSEAPDGSWKKRVRLGIAGAFPERLLARRLGAFCAPQPQDCRFFALARGGADEPVQVRGRHFEAPLLADLRRLSREQFRQIDAATAWKGRAQAGRGLVVLSPEAPAHIYRTAHLLRLQLDVSVAKAGAEGEKLGLTGGGAGAGTGKTAAQLIVWPPAEAIPEVFDGHPEQLEKWLRVRAVALLANTSEFEEDEPYEELGLPVGRLFVDNGTTDAEARAAVLDVARQFRGRVMFVARNATSKSHEWRQHGLPPDRFPSFGASDSMVYNASKYGCLGTPRNTSAEFWTGPARRVLTEFLDDVLAGKLQPSYPSEAPADEDGAPEPGLGVVRKLVGRRCRSVVEASEQEVLIEAFDEWRRDHANRTLYLDVLAPLLARWNITVCRLDLGYNECPPSVLPLISAGYSGYFFVPWHLKSRRLNLQRLKKLDPSFDRLLSFIAKHSEAKIDVPVVRAELEANVLHTQRLRAVAEAAGHPHASKAAAGVFGLLGVIAYLALSGRLRRRRPPAEEAPGASTD